MLEGSSYNLLSNTHLLQTSYIDALRLMRSNRLNNRERGSESMTKATREDSNSMTMIVL